VDAISGIFNTSRTATAIRLVDGDHSPALLVCHTSQGRKWFTRAPDAARNIVPPTRAIGCPFQPGNKRKPRSARNKVTALAERLVEGEAEEIVRSIIASAKSGNPAAISAVAAFLLPERRGRSIAIDTVGDLERTATSLAQVTQAVLSSALNGVISAEEAQNIGIIIAAAARA
jgi:hypothetical protein